MITFCEQNHGWGFNPFGEFKSESLIKRIFYFIIKKWMPRTNKLDTHQCQNFLYNQNDFSSRIILITSRMSFSTFIVSLCPKIDSKTEIDFSVSLILLAGICIMFFCVVDKSCRVLSNSI